MTSQNELLSGSSSQAIEWIARSDLPASARSSLEQFVRSFSELSFGRLNEDTLSSYERSKGIAFPRWLRTWMMTLAVLGSGRPASLKIDRYGEITNGETPKNPWFQYGFTLSPGSDFDRITLSGETLMIFAQNLSAPFEILAVRLIDSNDIWPETGKEVLLFNIEDIQVGGAIPAGDTRAVFSSLAELLDHVTAIQMSSGGKKPKQYTRAGAQ